MDKLFARDFNARFNSGAPFDTVENAIHFMASVLSIWQPYFVSFEPFFCQDKKVLKDRLGVGWMLFLPVAITRDQIPEAAQAISRNDEQGRMGR
ncbi:MAG: immunity 52 family protein [Burkholderiaceae bacterium]|nr:immunity 52 family protein [Burkholderiaceae bacterium]